MVSSHFVFTIVLHCIISSHLYLQLSVLISYHSILYLQLSSIVSSHPICIYNCPSWYHLIAFVFTIVHRGIISSNFVFTIVPHFAFTNVLRGNIASNFVFTIVLCGIIYHSIFYLQLSIVVSCHPILNLRLSFELSPHYICIFNCPSWYHSSHFVLTIVLLGVISSHFYYNCHSWYHLTHSVFSMVFRSMISSNLYFQLSFVVLSHSILYLRQNQKYRGMFETQKSGNKTSSGEIGLNIRTHASPEVGQDQVSGGVSVLCLHAAPVANVLWKSLTIR